MVQLLAPNCTMLLCPCMRATSDLPCQSLIKSLWFQLSKTCRMIIFPSVHILYACVRHGGTDGTSTRRQCLCLLLDPRGIFLELCPSSLRTAVYGKWPVLWLPVSITGPCLHTIQSIFKLHLDFQLGGLRTSVVAKWCAVCV